MRLLNLVCFIIIIGLSQPAYAQDSGYAPPPMFGGAPTPTKIIPKQVPQQPIEEPMLQSNIKTPPLPLSKPGTQSAKVHQQRVTPVIVTSKKPKTVEPEPIQSSEEPLVKKANIASAHEVERKREPIQPKPTGVVTGPKTMPAVQKDSVQSIVTFQEDPNTPVDLIDRAQKTEEPPNKEPKPVAPRREQPVEPITTDKQITLLFIKKHRDITPIHKRLLRPLLLTPDNYKAINIQAYARDGNAASLKRAFYIREYLIENGVKAQIINLRANGNRTETIPLDRVDIAIHVDKNRPITQ